jgi:hypothetical protein
MRGCVTEPSESSPRRNKSSGPLGVSTYPPNTPQHSECKTLCCSPEPAAQLPRGSKSRADTYVSAVSNR